SSGPGGSPAAGSSDSWSHRTRRRCTGSTCPTTPGGSARPTSATSRRTRRRSRSPGGRPTSAGGGPRFRCPSACTRGPGRPAAAVVGLAGAGTLARRGDWLGATAVTGTTGLLVSPISWAHHWVWILPALVLLIRGGHRIAAGAGYLLFAVAPFWYTPHAGGPS